jgi:hypothetical protein
MYSGMLRDVVSSSGMLRDVVSSSGMLRDVVSSSGMLRGVVSSSGMLRGVVSYKLTDMSEVPTAPSSAQSPLKRRSLYTSVHSATSQKTVIFFAVSARY